MKRTLIGNYYANRKGSSMTQYAQLTLEQRQAEYKAQQAAFAEIKTQGLSLNMARGKPGTVHLDLVSDLFTVMQTPESFISNGLDVRNYGELSGIPAAKNLFAEILGCLPEQVFVGGNSSLQLMYDTVAKAMTHGTLHSTKPWGKEEGLKWLCPAPGYDRHFAVCESFGFELITIPMTPEGPDMDAVEAAIQDPKVKGMWNVPKYSNPEGYIYSDAVIARLAAMKPAAPDFMLMWDNAYCIHELEGDFVPFANILDVCAQAGNPDMVYQYASTSKITLPGAGVACMTTSVANLKYLEKLMGIQAISYDKVNQQRHVLYLKDKANTLALMKRHAGVMAPKFRAVTQTLTQEVGDLGIATWNNPKGGYFVSLNAMEGTAKRTLELCKEAGVTMTPAGATFPYGIDPQDSNIRIAPSLPPAHELEQAMAVFCICLKMAALEKLGL